MRVYRVVFLNQGKLYEVYAKTVQQADLYGFIALEGLIFSTASTLVVDPNEERLRDEFKDVTRSLIPIHAVIRIDEMEKEGQAKIQEVGDKSNITPFPSSLYNPDRRPDK